MKESNNFINYIGTLFFVVVSVGLTLIFIEMRNNNSIQRSKFSHEMSLYFENNKIDSAIENDLYLKKPLLTTNKGRWSDKDLNNYLGFFELLSDYVDAGSLNYKDVFDGFSDDVLIAYNNKEIIKYISNTRVEAKDNEYYIKFEKMAKSFEKEYKGTKK